MTELLHNQAALVQSEFLQGLSAQDREAILAAAQRRSVERDEFLLRQGDPADRVYLLAQGRLRLSTVTPDGQEVIIRYVGPGEGFGVAAALNDMVYPVSIEAVEASLVLGWDRATFAQLMERHPRLAMQAMQTLAFRMREMQDRVRELQTERVERRIARALLRLVRQTGRKVEAGVLIDLPLTRQDLAEMTGTTLYTVSRVLSQWEQAGLVESGRERVLIRSPHGLVSIAEDLPPRSPS